jgi:quercetin dioxygenase-like cupin family protein
MRRGLKALILLTLSVGLAACAQEGEQQPAQEAAAEMEATRGQVYPNLPTDVVFANDWVVAQKALSEPGMWAGQHSHTGGQLAVVLTAGTMTYREGGEDTPVTYEAGDVFWVEPTEAHDHAITSESAVEFVLITLAEMDAMGGAEQAYPNVEADIVFENDRVIAQRLENPVGEWVGEHSHTGGQLAVVLTPGTVTYRVGGTDSPVTYAVGDVFRVEAVESHDHAVTSDSPTQAILVTIK